MKQMRHHDSRGTIRVAILSTIATNIGDEFIRDGVICLLRSTWGDTNFDFRVFNKHRPWTFFPRWHPVQGAAVLNATFGRFWRRYANAASRVGKSFFDNADLIVQSGTPVIWKDVEYTSEWNISFWRNIAPRVARTKPLLNIGGGSCYPWHAQPDTLSGKDRGFAQHMVRTAMLTTTRESLAAKLLSEAAGVDIPALSCPALLAGQTHVAPDLGGSTFILNFMPRAGHFDELRQINPESWQTSFSEAVRHLEARFNLVFLCHNATELQAARTLWPKHRAIFPQTTRDYFEAVKGAYGGLVNRLHAAVGLAGLGIPSIAVGTDTRMLMTKQIGIETLFAPDVTGTILVQHLKSLLERRDEISVALLRMREETLSNYINLLKSKASIVIPHT
jgi:hypothetical protein